MSIELSGHRKFIWNWGNLLKDDICPAIMDTQSGELICHLRGHTQYIRSCLELPGDRLLTWSNDQTLRVWRLEDGHCLAVLEGHTEYVSEAVCLDNNDILSASGDGTLRRWNAHSGECVQVFPWPMPDTNEGRTTAQIIRGYNQHHVLTSTDYHSHLYTFNDEKHAINLFSDSYSPRAGFIDCETFFVEQYLDGDSLLYIYAITDNAILARIPLGGWLQDTAKLTNNTLLATTTTFRKNEIQVKLIQAGSGNVLATLSVPAEKPISTFQVSTNEVQLITSDYRELRFEPDTLKLISVNGIIGIKRDGFISYAPELINSKTHLPDDGQAQRLKVNFLTRQTAESAIIQDDNKSRDMIRYYSHSVSSDQTLIIHAGESQPIDTSNSNNPFVREPTLNAPDNPYTLIECLYDIRGSDLKHIAKLAAQTLSCATSELIAITEAIEPYDSHYRAPVTLLPGRAHSLLKWTSDGTLFRIFKSNHSDVLQSEKITSQLAMIGGSPLLDIHGRCHLYNESSANYCYTALDPVASGCQVALGDRYHLPDACAFIDRHNRLFALSGNGVVVIDATNGKQLAFLDSGYNMRVWGMALISEDTLITWSRANLRSWNANTLQPLSELQDPAEWGPAREVIKAISGNVAITVGKYSIDSRVLLWNGTDKLTVYSGHDNEVMNIREIAPGIIASRARCLGENYRKIQTHIWNHTQF